MRNIILVTVATFVFCAGWAVYPNVSVAQDAVEEDLESDSPSARNRHNRDGDMRNRRGGSGDRRARATDPPEDPIDRRDSFNDDGEDLNNRREDRRAGRE